MQARGLPLPTWYLDEPDEPDVFGRFCMVALLELSTCRLVMANMGGTSVSPIPWTALSMYADRFGLDPENFDAFAVVVRILEDAYVDWLKPAKTSRGADESSSHDH